MATLIRPLVASESRAFALYRRAAGKLHERFWPYRHQRFEARIFRANLPDDADLIPDADFIALLTAFRLIYAERELSNFGRIANIVYRAGDQDARSIVAVLRESWQQIPRAPWRYVLHDERFGPGMMIDTWMNGEVFHQDEHEVRRADLLKDCGPMALMTLQLTVHGMCYAALGLDNVCALLLGEPLRPVPAPPGVEPEAG